jgi:glycosyltransferase involved in cell wall biosynthesis
LFTEPGTNNPFERPYILALSRLDAKKGFDLLIQAFGDALHPDTFEGWRLVIAGDGDPHYVQTLRSLAARRVAAERIHFTGWISGPEKLALLRGASLFVLPSLQENFGMSLVEAMTAAVPVVVTPGVNLARDIEDAGGGWLVDRDVDALARGLRVAMADGNERRMRGHRARAFAERFRWPAVASQLLNLYEQVTNREADRTLLGPATR